MPAAMYWVWHVDMLPVLLSAAHVAQQGYLCEAVHVEPVLAVKQCRHVYGTGTLQARAGLASQKLLDDPGGVQGQTHTITHKFM